MRHQMWDELLQGLSKGARPGGGPPARPGGSSEMLAAVLERVAMAGGPVPRSAISKGGMLIRPTTLASGTVGKAADALVSVGNLLTEDVSTRSGQPGPPITPLRFSDKWATVGIHIDQQHGGPDGLAGIICGLDRKPLTELLTDEVPRKGGQHDLRGLAEKISRLTESLLAQLDGPRRFLGVGVEIGGHVHQGVLKDSVHAGWSHEIDLHQILAEELDNIPELHDVPVAVENDVNALAIHGCYERELEGLDVALLTVFRQGVGGALILNGLVYRGVGSMAPEPGHIPVEHPEDNSLWEPPPTPKPGEARTFADECLCSTRDRKKYGHADTLAVPARIEGELAALNNGDVITLEKAAAAPRTVYRGEMLAVSDEARVLGRAGRALGRALVSMIDLLNPGQIVLRLPEALATPIPQSSGNDYLDAVEGEVDGAYSTGPHDARHHHFRLTVQAYAEAQVARAGAVAAATTAFNAFLEHARGRDGCLPAAEGTSQDPRKQATKHPHHLERENRHDSAPPR